MDIRRTRTLCRLADVIISLASVFLLLDAMLGFTAHQETFSVQSAQVGLYLNSANLATSCRGGFSNEQTVAGVTQTASRGTPFNAYQLVFTNIGATTITIHSVNVELIDSRNKIFTQHYTGLGNGAGITLGLGKSRRIVEAYGINHPVAACAILSWQS